ncbi:MAG: hypothetical protein O3C43_07605 [Verrucomicrobia bacterium]|nr:hypothetical protein [Verrucomicrobiota bacterium]
MKKIILLLAAVFFSQGNAQVVVNGTDLNEEVDIFEQPPPLRLRR